MFFRRRKKDKAEASALQDAKIAESRNLLLNAAVETTDLAANVTRLMQHRMEDAIQQFVQTARIINDALLICELNGNITAFNPAAQRMFGLPDEPSLPATSYFERGSMPMIAEELWALGRSKNRTLSGVHTDGGMFPAHIRVSILERSDNTTLVLLVVQDLTMIQKNFNNSMVGYAVVAHQEVVAANQTVSRLYGFSQMDLLGMKAEVLTRSKDRNGNHLDLIFEVARILWEGEEGMLITIREPRSEACPTCGRRGYHSH